MMKAISNLRGKFGFLSNFHDCKIIMDELTFESAEAAFQGLKDPERLHEFQWVSASESKKLGRKVSLRSDWDEVKDDIMRKVLRLKFYQNTDLLRKLKDTGSCVLIEGNTWHDNYWGICTCDKCEKIQGKNVLGKLLMELRNEVSC
ncbi:putative NADAR family protein [Aeromonas phage LAh_9]|uniref:Putative NADAR family protein n=1 Tax=Aeromonas phage LAh_9 TaxID=2591033 RepID=A0A514A105_9CAUD|nr:putative NADAR family protein [Aeromonas phage LAh_9]QDH46926.1 putative NADAR family protein [Aeromonas phage LAh_9]